MSARCAGWSRAAGRLAAAALLVPCTLARAADPPSAGPAREFDEVLEREWKEGRFPSVAAGIVRRDGLVHARGLGLADRESGREATPATLYRIGSVTKVFTTTLLAMLRDRGVVRLDDPVAKYLPESIRLPADPRGAAAITLRHLATHSSGLPRIPVNLKPGKADPYGGYTIEDLHAGLPVTVLDRPVGDGYGYSNLGVGLLGHALERAAGRPFETLLRESLLEPLGMRRSFVAGPAAEGLATGYSGKNPARKATPWDLGCLAPAGGLASSVEDLARFVALQLRAGEAGVEPVSGGTLAELQTPQRLIDGWGAAVGLGWHVSPRAGGWEAVWHTGCVAGFHAYVGLARGRGVGVIFLANATREDCEAGPRLLEAAVRAFGVEPPREVDPVLRKAIEEVSRHIAADPPASLGDLFEANFLAQVPLPAVRSLFRELHESFGRCEGFEIVPGDTSRSARAVYRFSSRKKVPCDIEVESSGKIIYFFIRREES